MRWDSHGPVCDMANARLDPASQVIVDRDRLDALAALAEAIESRRHTNEQWTAWGTARQPATILALIAEVRAARINPQSNFGDDENDRMSWQQDEPTIREMAWERRLRAAEAVCEAAREYLAHDGSGIKESDPAWRGDFDAFRLADARVLLRARLAAIGADPSRETLFVSRHPFTCGYCDWGRDGAYHDHTEYQSHMAIAHPEYKS